MKTVYTVESLTLRGRANALAAARNKKASRRGEAGVGTKNARQDITPNAVTLRCECFAPTRA